MKSGFNSGRVVVLVPFFLRVMFSLRCLFVLFTAILIHHDIKVQTPLLSAEFNKLLSAVFPGTTFAALDATRPFPIARVRLFVAVDGGGIFIDGFGSVGALPELSNKMI